MTSATFERWKVDSSIAFTSEAKDSAVIIKNVIHNRTFVRVEILSRTMMKSWFDLMSLSNPELIHKAQLNTRIAGPCDLYMCYLTANHTQIEDPTAMSCIVPMYINQPYVCFQGLMGLDKSFVGPSDASEQLALIVTAAKMAPRMKRVSPFRYVFISPVPDIGIMLRKMLERKEIRFSRCKAGSLDTVSNFHVKKSCKCPIEIGDWGEVDIIMHVEPYEFILPRMVYNGTNLGCINVPHATGRSFDFTKKGGWTVEDEGIAALTNEWVTQSEYLEKNAKEISFLSILLGIDGIHVIDFDKFITIDPVEVMTPPPPTPATGSGP
jgi:hypothetical protein